LKPALRRIITRVVRYLFRVLNPLLLGDWTALSAKQPDQTTKRNIRRVWSFVTPTAADVVANYLRGVVLFGWTSSSDGYFDWTWFPSRAVITRETAKVPKRLRPLQRRGEFEVRYNQDFEAIVHYCQRGHDNWITPALIDVYRELQSLGLVATVGTYRDGRLVGGLWGLGIGRVLGIMSMFHLENHAGALALAALSDTVSGDGRWSVIDCGQLNPNFERYGAKEIPAGKFCELVLTTLKQNHVRASDGQPSAGCSGRCDSIIAPCSVTHFLSHGARLGRQTTPESRVQPALERQSSNAIRRSAAFHFTDFIHIYRLGSDRAKAGTRCLPLG
jgi:leucyl/phenylalanyl-tRNA--protein transferase